MESLTNKSFTLGQLIELTGAHEKLEKWDLLIQLLKELSPRTLSNGRLNHQLVSDMITSLSDGVFESGGQGNSLPDMFSGGARVEQKAFAKDAKKCRVAKSRFFGSNSGTGELKKFLSENPNEKEKFDWMKEKSYSDDDLWYLTQTGKWDGDIASVQCYVIDRKTVLECLDPGKGASPYSSVVLSKVIAACSEV